MMMVKGTLEIAGGHIDPIACDLIGISESDFQQKSISTSAPVVDARSSQAQGTGEGSSDMRAGYMIAPRLELTHPQSGPRTSCIISRTNIVVLILISHRSGHRSVASLAQIAQAVSSYLRLGGNTEDAVLNIVGIPLRSTTDPHIAIYML
jgi:hypothetical protein